MERIFDVEISFEFEPFKVLFEEIFFKKLNKPLSVKINICYSKNESNYKDLVYASTWMSIEFFDTYFNNDFQQNHIDFSNLIANFFDYILLQFKVVDLKHLLKISFNSKGNILIFLFNDILSFDFFKNGFSQAICKIQDYVNADTDIIKQISESYKQKENKVYFEFTNGTWIIINLLYNAGKYHHSQIAKNIHDKRIAKPDILVNEEYLNETIKYRDLRRLKVNRKNFVRIKPNDIALYSNIATANLKKAREIYDDENSVLWKYIQMPEDERKLIDYYELAITAIILAYSSVEALVNIAIPENFFHSKDIKNKETGLISTTRFPKAEIERWYNMDDKMNKVLPEALNIPLPNQQKWWAKFDKLEKLRNKFIHVVESKSDERYSELHEKQLFAIVESHIEVIKFFGKWATDNQHYLLNELPYGFGCDDIMPILISEEDYNQVYKEQRGIK